MIFVLNLVLQLYYSLKTMSKKQLEYIWIGGNGELRSKTKVFNWPVLKSDGTPAHFSLIECPEWNYDGSSTGQASGEDSEVILKPCALFPDPFRKSNNAYLVLCATYTPDGKPLDTNNRAYAEKIFSGNTNRDASPWYGLEQEYFIIDPNHRMPLGFNEIRPPKLQGQYYCSAGAGNAFGREVAEEHLQACLYANINISGINAEVAPGQWEFQVGPSSGLNAGDHLWTARYILQRIAEKHGYYVSFHPKPAHGDWNGSGCHTNFSTKQMREGEGDKTGLDFIDEAITKLSKKHKEHMEVYGSDNDQRMTGAHETASFDTFSDGTANRGASIRRGNKTVADKKGYFEDRRPSANCDPYLVTGKLFQTIVIED